MKKSDLSRRQFIAGVSALGASAYLSKSELFAQGPGGNVRRMDTHHHFGSPGFVAMTKAETNRRMANLAAVYTSKSR